MNLISDFQEAQKKLLAQSRSPEYQASCQHYRSESARLLGITQSFLRENAQTLTERESSCVRREYASGSDLHRGFYCPCPDYELIVGNAHRGKLLKRITSRSKPTHEYGFDSDGRLLWAKQFYDGKQGFTEHMLYDADRRYGITVDSSNRLHIITEEVLDGERLIRYIYFLCTQFDDSFLFGELNSYEYTYDEQGLSQSVWNSFMDSANLPPFPVPNTADSRISDFFASVSSMPPVLRRNAYCFNRENGFITSYSCNGRTNFPRIIKKA